MKSKITTKAMAFFLAVVLSFTMVIPSTFATDDTDTEDDISTEIMEEPDEETAVEPDDLITIDEDEFTADAVLEEHIEDTVKASYVDSVEDMQIVNYIKVMNTLFNGDFMSADDTIDSIMGGVSEGNADAYNKFLASMNTNVAVYDVNPDSDYFVAYVNTMMNTENVSVFDWAFAINDDSGTIVNGCYYDSSTGLAYIPKDLYFNEDEDYVIGRLQVQLGQKISGDFADVEDITTASIVDESDEVSVYTTLSDIFNPETTVYVETGLNEDEMTVIVNGIEMPESEYDYDTDTGEIVLSMFSSDIGTISVVADDDYDYGIQTLASAWTDPWNGTDYDIYPESWSEVVAINENSSLLTVPTWVTIGTALVCDNASLAHRTSSYITNGVNEASHDWYDGTMRGYVYNEGSLGDYNGDAWLVSWIRDWYEDGTTHVYDSDPSHLTLQYYNEYFKIDLGASGQFTYKTGFNGGWLYNEYKGNSDPTGKAIEGINDLGVILGQCAHCSVDANGDPISGGQQNITATAPAMFRVVYDGIDPTTGQEFLLMGLVTAEFGYQTGFGFFRVDIEWEEQDGFLSLVKTSSDPIIVADNTCYSLEGAQYGVYTNSACTDQVATLTTDKNGNTETIEVEAGTYYIKETSASPGYELDKTIYTVVVNSGENTVFTATEVPVDDEMGLKITKISDDDVSNPAPLNGAQFTIHFYGGNYSLDEINSGKPSSDGVATRTWILETKYNELTNSYVALLSNDYLVSGSDALYTMNGVVALPLGTITIEETKAPEGYMLDGYYVSDSYGTTISDDDGVVCLKVEDLNEVGTITTGNEYTKTDAVVHGGIAIIKRDSETYTMMDTPQGDASLLGAEFTITNDNNYQVKVNGNIYDPGKDVLTISTQYYFDGTDGWYYATTPVEHDENGNLVYDDNGDLISYTLPYGDYTITETKSSEGYLIGEKHSYQFSIDYDGEFQDNVIDVTPNADGNSGQLNDVIRGGMEIMKRDLESGRNVAEGGATFEGAEFTIYNESANPVLVNGNLVWPEGKEDDKGNISDGIVMVLITNEDGYATTGELALPYGSYKVVETQSPEGNLPDDEHKSNTKDDAETVGVLTREFVIRTNGEMVDLTDKTYDFNINDYVECAEDGSAIYNQVIRGDFAIRKINDEQHTMAGVVFSIESKTTGEIHYFMTDENGAYSSASEYAEHTHNTNYYDDESHWNETDLKSLEDHDGIWFYGYGNDDEATKVDDSLGALPYDTYIITEIETDVNSEYEMWSDEFTVGPNDNNIVIDLNDIENKLKPVIWTYSEFEESESKYAPTSDYTIVTDEVGYEGLQRNTEYTLVAKLYNPDTQNFVKDADGNDVEAITQFTARATTGTVRTEIHFDSTGLDGSTLVVFEYLYKGDTAEGQAYVVEDDPAEADQMLYFPAIGTTAIDEGTGINVSYASTEITIVDTIEYSNLRVGRNYTVVGTLMDQATGEPALDAYGNEITAQTTFRADESSGTVDVTFVFDGSLLEGEIVVAFEDLYYGSQLYASHADIEDEDQTVYIPKIHTSAWSSELNLC